MFQTQPSPSGGLGIFATATIPAGTIYWRPTDSNTLKLKRSQYYTLCHSECTLSPLSKALQEAFASYAVYFPLEDALVLFLDNARFMNHSETPNSKMNTDGSSVALRDIHPGEELCEDYGQFTAYCWPEPWDPSPATIDAEAVKRYLATHPEVPCGPSVLTQNKCTVQPVEGNDGEPGLFLGRPVKAGELALADSEDSVMWISRAQWDTFMGSTIDGSPMSVGIRDAIYKFGVYHKSMDSVLVRLDNGRFIQPGDTPTIIICEDSSASHFSVDIPSGVQLYRYCSGIMFNGTIE
eukprot:NODE_5293_length_960_cov_138.823178_g5078_i0.p1 GENE.NODE_5293_length_960_cov_138.823178_g5078_i0~~NODE_5293_length_960_cov_138.823178_g5078_i0.p1  ORF type:complete len:294 (-),score=16.18 NODE_5293_length_960_cov_138.823178_g5078_i0:14-895(-)